jgi:molybdopterin-guanine dinucleotide biosynthesis adapter protein
MEGRRSRMKRFGRRTRLRGNTGKTEQRNGGQRGNVQLPAVCQVVGYKNSGKTTLICALIPLLKQRGCSVAVIKHDAHNYDMDHHGTDTWKQRQAGAAAVAITNNIRTSVIEERSTSLSKLIADFSGYDYVIVEGFKQEAYPKIVLLHSDEDRILLKQASNIAAIAVWETMEQAAIAENWQDKLFSINDIEGIANLLWEQRSYFQNFNI